MPRYLFHIVGEDACQNNVRDSEGAVLRDATEARKEAVGLAQDIARHGINGSTKWKILVTDENGRNVVTVPLSQVQTLRNRAWRIWRGLFAKLVRRSSRALVASVIAAAIGVQAVLLSFVLRTPAGSSDTYEMAAVASKGTVVNIRFVGSATVDQISAFLGSYNSTIIDGPRIGGFFRVRMSAADMPSEDYAGLVASMGREPVVDLIAAME
jgi:hypothetical protein